jgi:hypothetical protein
MTKEEQAKLLEDGDKYSLSLRLSVKMSMAGVSEAEFAKNHNARHPLVNTVNNHLRDIERGSRKVTPELILLAQRL